MNLKTKFDAWYKETFEKVTSNQIGDIHYRIFCVASCSYSEPVNERQESTYQYYEDRRKFCPKCGISICYDIERKDGYIHWRSNWMFYKAKKVAIKQGWKLISECYVRCGVGFTQFSKQNTKQDIPPKKDEPNVVDLDGKFTPEEVKSALKFLRKVSHPDCGGDETAFRFVQHIYEQFRL